MWETINDSNDILHFMESMCYFHDSCIKEMSYVSGAHVSDDLSMYPLNNLRVLRVIIQRQYENNSMIEMEFHGLKRLKLFPVDESYTCEIVEAAMVKKDGDIYWSDCGDLLESESNDYMGTLICASKLRWRSIENRMGEKEFYQS